MVSIGGIMADEKDKKEPEESKSKNWVVQGPWSACYGSGGGGGVGTNNPFTYYAGSQGPEVL
jgi:hypothetical protein